MSDHFQYHEADPDSIAATWRPLRTHALRWRPGWDLAALLDEWEPRLTGLDDPDTAAMVTLPSREVGDAPALIRHGFAPLLAIAERPAGRPHLSRASDVTIRAATAADLDVVLELCLHTLRFDTQFRVLTLRENTAQHLRSVLAEVISREDAVWLAERAGVSVGVLRIDFPPHSEWMHGYSDTRPLAYIEHLGVRPDTRGSGAGSALVAHAHALLDGAGIKSTLLHHALPNPLSTPFWYSHGYQPRWTVWVRRPALRSSHGVSS